MESLRYGDVFCNVLYIYMFHGIGWLFNEKRTVLCESMVWNFIHVIYFMFTLK
jgi:hypothetical protein